MKNTISLRTEEDEPFYTYYDSYMRHFLRQAAYGGLVWAFNQYYKSKSFDDILKVISEELKVEGNVYDKIEAYMNYKKAHYTIFEKEYESNFSDYRDERVEEKVNYINEKFSKLPIHQLMSKLKIIELLWDFDCVSWYPSAIWDKNSIYPKIETGYAFEKHMKNELFEKFNIQGFTQGSAILKIKFYNPKNLTVQHLSVKEKEKKFKLIVWWF